MGFIKKHAKGVALIAGTAALASALMLVGCGSNDTASDDAATDDAATQTEVEDKGTITVAACTTPHAEILNDVVAPLLAEQGYTLEVVVEDDYSIPNRQLEEEEVDANYFQHQPYLDSEIEEQGYDLTTVTSVHYEPFGLYAGTKASLEELADGDKVAVPNDTTNEARALLLLEQEGLIELDDGAGITATTKDITSNPLNLDIYEVDAELTAHVLDDVAIAAINANYALDAGLSPADDALAVEAADGEAATTYANILVVRTGDENSEWAQALATALTSDEVRTYINDTYSGAVLPVF